MPIARSEKVKSLYDSCVNCVINHITYFIRPQQNPEKMIEIKEKHNLLLQLPFHILEEIFEILFHESVATKDAILNLVTSQFTFLTLFGIPYNEKNSKFFPKFMKLQVLKLFDGDDTDASMPVDDHCLQFIGTHCEHLRTLDMQYCFEVTDVGIQWLCSSTIDNQEVHGGTGKCKSLEVLKVQNCCNVTKKGIQIALENLPLLKVLHHQLTFDVLVELAQKTVNQEVPNVPRFPLSVLRVYEQQLRDKEEYTIGSIGKALSLCPSLVRLDIRLVKKITDSDLLGITTLKMLRELTLYRWIGEVIDVTFDGGVDPLLVVIGSSLTYLNLSCFRIVNFSAIIEYCPNLGCLTAHLYMPLLCFPIILKQLFRTECRREKFCLSHLERLIVEYCPTISSSDIWLGLLSSPFLTYVNIYGCDSLTDDVFQNATKNGRFQNLETLYLTSCNSITYRGIDALMTDANPIRFLITRDCKNLIKADAAHLKLKYDKWNDGKLPFNWSFG